jgi:hypothetical protein
MDGVSALYPLCQLRRALYAALPVFLPEQVTHGCTYATVEHGGPDTTPIGTGRDERDPPIGDFFSEKNRSACNSLTALGRRRAFPLGAACLFGAKVDSICLT